MCGRFYFPETQDDGLAERILQEAVRRRAALTGDGTIALGEVAPTETVAALAAGKNGEPGGYPMRWGFTRYDGKGFIINTRSETALTKPMFRQSMLERRCLIPAAHYFEWEKRGREKIRYAIRPKAEGLMFLAGIYRFEEGEKLPVMSILTREPSGEIRFIHDRMPVIFTEKTREAWLDRGADPAKALERCEIQMRFEIA